MVMKGCDCISEPPHFDLPPPPDPSLIWHLISDEPFEPAEQCSSNQFVSISDIGGTFYSEDDAEESNHQKLAANILIGVAAISVILLISVCFVVIGRVRRKRRQSLESSKKMSSDSILVAGEHLWHYNSMKHPQNSNMLMYSNNSNAGSRMFHHTPTTLRSYIGAGTPIMAPNVPIRHSESTTLRLNPNDTSSAYHTVSVSRQPPSSEVYEEISPIGTLGHVGYMTTRHQNAPNMLQTQNGRMSIRRPPPSCRPPQPPQSPACSDGSYDKEITRITNATSTTVDSGSPRQWDDGVGSSRSHDGGRESGYGTAPSLQWKSPSGSTHMDVDRSPYVVAQPPNPNTMTYV